MAQLSLFLPILFFLITIFSITSTVEPAYARSRHSKLRTYIESACHTTRYPKLCVHCLSNHISPNISSIESPEDLAQVALSVSLYKARYARAYMLKVAKELKAIKAREYQLVRDCVHQINDSIFQLTLSIKEVRGLREAVVDDDLIWHINNVETWVSSALTDAITCVDQFPGTRMSKLKATIKGKVLNVAQVTSNALALFHRFASRYKTADGSTQKKPLG